MRIDLPAKRSVVRTVRVAMSVAGIAALVWGGPFVGCSREADKCERLGTCPPAATNSSGSGTGGTIDTTCVPSANSSPVSDSCGMFVSASLGDDANGGTQDKPLKTLSKALELAGKANKPLYACAETFEEAVTAPAGMMLYGGLDCAEGWRYVGDATKTTIAATADAIGLRFAGGGDTTHIEDAVVKAADATIEGGSSIAALAEAGASVELVRCELVAGNGRDGAKGETPTESVGPNDPNDPAIRGVNGAAACTGDVLSGNPGGGGTTNVLCSASVGGNGGAGTETNGQDGTDGQPAGALGQHGTGQPAMGAWNCGSGGGQVGDNGLDGMPGAGAPEAMVGVLSIAGFTGAAGETGKDGAPGQGGGGGGGAKGKVGCNGASGGGGGAGGCGGKGGLGGQAGGASIALVSLGSTLSFTDTKLTAGNGGNGGEGGDGQAGGTGGNGGNGGLGMGTSNACAGGQAGQGGFGGKGGGGRGGHSIGIAYQGEEPSSKGVTITTAAPGTGGAGADAAGQGADGVKAGTQALP